MGQETGTQRFSKRTLRQVSLDSVRALTGAFYCPDRSTVESFHCIDFQPETETSFGRQLWYFDAIATNEQNRELVVYGFLEYSEEFGSMEIVQDGVFESIAQRARFETVYHTATLKPTWRHPSHRWLFIGMTLVGSIWLASLLLNKLLAS